jgi:hypothetical protein
VQSRSVVDFAVRKRLPHSLEREETVAFDTRSTQNGAAANAAAASSVAVSRLARANTRGLVRGMELRRRVLLVVRGRRGRVEFLADLQALQREFEVKHASGSARTEGFYAITVEEKMANRPASNKAKSTQNPAG